MVAGPARHRCSAPGKPRLTSAERLANLAASLARSVPTDRAARIQTQAIGSTCLCELPSAARSGLPTSVILTLVALGPAHAQSGSAGGSIGNDEKSLSGSREPPRASESERPARRSKPEADEPRRASQSGGGGGSFDGAWVVNSVGTTCSGSSRNAVVVTSGRIIGQGVSGTSQPERRSQRDQQFKRRHRHQRRPTFRPQRLRNFQAIRWMQRKMDGIEAVASARSPRPAEILERQL